MRYLIAILLTALIPASSFAGHFKTGLALLEECEPLAASYEAWECHGYIEGIHDAHNTYEASTHMMPKFCMPKGVNSTQLVKVVVKHLNEHPEELHLTASSLVSEAFSVAFPASVKDDGTGYCPDEGATK
jgi:hypothetical protein